MIEVTTPTYYYRQRSHAFVERQTILESTKQFLAGKMLVKNNANMFYEPVQPTIKPSALPRILIDMKFQSALIILALAMGSLASTTADVLADISTINTDVTKLNNDVTAFPNSGGSLASALAIHTDATTLNTAITKATTDANAVTPSPFSEADGQSVLTAVNAVKPTILSALTAIVAKKPAFTALPVGGIPALVKSDLATLNASTTAFENALIAKAPADLKASASALASTINAAFATAIAAYA